MLGGCLQVDGNGGTAGQAGQWHPREAPAGPYVWFRAIHHVQLGVTAHKEQKVSSVKS